MLSRMTKNVKFSGSGRTMGHSHGTYVNARRESKYLRQITGIKTVHTVFKQFLEVLFINVIKLLGKTVIMWKDPCLCLLPLFPKKNKCVHNLFDSSLSVASLFYFPWTCLLMFNYEFFLKRILNVKLRQTLSIKLINTYHIGSN